MTSGLDPVFGVLARLSIALLFVAAARHKRADPLRFEGIVADYRLAPAGWSFGIARGLVLLEIGLVLGLGCSFFVPALSSIVSLAAATVLAGYAVAIGVNGQWYFTDSISLLGEWIFSEQIQDAENDSGTFGMGIETRGHSFKLVVTNQTRLQPTQILGGSASPFDLDQLRLGFNITRLLPF